MKKPKRRHPPAREVSDRVEFLLAQVAELNLRVRYIMESYRMRPTSSVVGANGQPIATGQPTTMYDHYLIDRENFIRRLEAKELARVKAALAEEERLRAAGAGSDIDGSSRTHEAGPAEVSGLSPAGAS